MAKLCPDEHACGTTVTSAMQMCAQSGQCTQAELNDKRIEDGCIQEQMDATNTKFKACVKHQLGQCGISCNGAATQEMCHGMCVNKMINMVDGKILTCLKGAMEHNKQGEEA